MPQSTSYKTVIIGGGAIGLGIAFHLARMGDTDVLLVERNQLTSGTSWHAAGIIGPLRGTMNATRLVSYATELMPELEKMTGQDSGYRRTGGYWLATEPSRMQELRRIHDLAWQVDIKAKLLLPDEVCSRDPWLNTRDLAGGLWVDDDAHASPVDLCMAYARYARSRGVEMLEGVAVTGFTQKHGRVREVLLSDGSRISCDRVVNCAGAWAHAVGQLAGVPVPLQAVQHMYVVTEPIDELPLPLPVVRDLDQGIYIKGDAGKVVLGGFEPNAIAWDASGREGAVPFLELPEDWQQFEPFMQAGLDRLPALQQAGIQHFMNGPESFTPDSKPLLGASPFLKGFYVAAGLNSTGMMSSAGVGKAMAEWLTAGEPPFDLWEVDIARFDHQSANTSYLHQRMKESVADVMAMHWPFKQSTAGRELKTPPLHKALLEAGGIMGSFAGWERPMWFARDGEATSVHYCFHEQNWWPMAAREAKHLSEQVALFDLSPFSKFDVSGTSALDYLQWVFANNIDVAVGKAVYGQMLNERGGMEADVTITRLEENRFRITGGAPTRWRDRAWLQTQRDQGNYEVTINDVSDEEIVLAVMGPRSLTLVQSLGVQNMTDLGFAQGRDVHIGGITVRATRLSFVGELGVELSIPVQHADTIYRAVIDGGKAYNLIHAGLFCLESCRLEKGFRHWGHDLGPFDTPLEAGLGFAVDFNKPGGFLGRDALLTQKDRGLDRSLLLLQLRGELENHPLLLHDEPVIRDGQLAGHTSSGGRGFRVSQSLAFAWINHAPGETKSDFAESEYMIRVAGKDYPATVLTRAPYDPGHARMTRADL